MNKGGGILLATIVTLLQVLTSQVVDRLGHNNPILPTLQHMVPLISRQQLKQTSDEQGALSLAW